MRYKFSFRIGGKFNFIEYVLNNFSFVKKQQIFIEKNLKNDNFTLHLLINID